ncbi:MAG: hypothetical protein ACYTEZ_04075 [Planctomycetota bacterium]
MIGTLAYHTFRECFRRPFPYVAVAVIALIALASHLFQVFSFGAGDLETANLAISAVFLAGLVHAALLGTALVRAEVTRGTFGLLLSQPVGLPTYLLGRLVGLAGASIATCALVAAAVSLILLLPVSRATPDLFGGQLLGGWGRVLLPVVVLDAAALAISAVLPRTVAPVALVGLFVAGSLAGDSAVGWILPDFSLFGLEAGAAPSWGLLMLYTCIYTTIFLLIAYLVLAARAPLRSQS